MTTDARIKLVVTVDASRAAYPWPALRRFISALGRRLGLKVLDIRAADEPERQRGGEQ